ncbi:MAG: hypothetical protein NC936_02980 [Candidatus Omnitrophica bacterium]|nr:hypothetical protein [Candidatus Omnitrophota bacterium]
MLDYLGIFKEFNKKKIKYIVAGGMAVNFYGVPRMTYDIDLLLDMQDMNLKKFLLLMKKWGFKPKVPVAIMDFADRKKRQEWIKNKNMKAFNLVNPAWAISEIDVIIDSPINYTKASKHSRMIILNNVPVPTISKNDLILMKRAAARKQDKDDIENLKKTMK